MAYKYSYEDKLYVGLSTDTKPAEVEECDKLLEIDTGNTFMFFNDQWYPL